jgi:hypothetical protein
MIAGLGSYHTKDPLPRTEGTSLLSEVSPMREASLKLRPRDTIRWQDSIYRR